MNFWIRLFSSIILVILTAITVSLGKEVLIASLLLISVIGYWEFTRATKVNGSKKLVNFIQVVGIFGVVGYYISLYLNNQILVAFLFILTLTAILSVYVVKFPKYHANQIVNSYFGLIYVPVMLSFVYLTRSLEQGIYIVWLIFISSWISDTFAYCVGMLIGKHKLAPNLSPKKSIEGSVGGVIASTVVGGLYAYFIVSKHIDLPGVVWMFALIGGIGSIVSQVGDLVASGIKRNFDIKDYGHCIPGHGGIMDRFDSVILVAPMIYFLAVFFTNL